MFFIEGLAHTTHLKGEIVLMEQYIFQAEIGFDPIYALVKTSDISIEKYRNFELQLCIVNG